MRVSIVGNKTWRNAEQLSTRKWRLWRPRTMHVGCGGNVLYVQQRTNTSETSVLGTLNNPERNMEISCQMTTIQEWMMANILFSCRPANKRFFSEMVIRRWILVWRSRRRFIRWLAVTWEESISPPSLPRCASATASKKFNLSMAKNSHLIRGSINNGNHFRKEICYEVNMCTLT